MKLWLVKRPYDTVGYDEYDAFVVRAKDENSARIEAAKEGSDRWVNEAVWLDSSTVVTEIKVSGKEEMILGSFNAG